MTWRKLAYASLLATTITGPLGTTGETVAGQRARIAVLSSRDAAPYREVIAGFRASLEERGIEARVEISFLEDRPGSGTEAVERAVTGRADLIFALGSEATDAACSQPQVPVLATMIFDLEALNKSARATGVSVGFPVETELSWVKRFLPQRKRVGVLFSSARNGAMVAEAKTAAEELGLELVPQEVETPQHLPAALKSLSRRVDVLWAVPDNVVYAPSTAKAILLFSFRNKIPLLGLSKAWVKAGALYALDRDYSDIGAQCGKMAETLLAGPSGPPPQPETPRRVRYFVNLKTARHNRIEPPDDLVRNAAQVFE